ncbi:MAG: 4a-hydroxytetrahydrobiopterin dehydratase [Planctomycetes bacterium]|nr:4a-hydroxytetrahydrobiopterin dehydratase [Planctomycetota bacterium]
MSELSAKQCVPCQGGVPPLKGPDLAQMHEQVRDWEVVDEHHLAKQFEFPDFVQALAWVNRIGELAEQQGHHPDLHLGWGKVVVEIWTHKNDGLNESDFILAAKIDQL